MTRTGQEGGCQWASDACGARSPPAECVAAQSEDGRGTGEAIHKSSGTVWAVETAAGSRTEEGGPDRGYLGEGGG